MAFDTEWHQRRLRFFDEAKVIATRLANSRIAPEQEVRRFDELYFADLIGVERPGGEVEAAMVRFRRKLRGEPGAPADPLEQLALRLALACDSELKASKEELLKQYEAIATFANPQPVK